MFLYFDCLWDFFKSTPRKFLLCSIKARNPEQARGTHLTCSGSQSEQDSLHIAHRHCSNIIKANNVSARYIKTVGMHFYNYYISIKGWSQIKSYNKLL